MFSSTRENILHNPTSNNSFESFIAIFVLIIETTQKVPNAATKAAIHNQLAHIHPKVNIRQPAFAE
jgi:hypothetical protein